MATIALKEMEHFDRYGLVNMDDRQCIYSFEEKRSCEKGLINAGFFIVNKDRFLENVPSSEVFSVEKDFFELQLSNKAIYGFKTDGFFIDIGIPEDFEKAQQLPEDLALATEVITQAQATDLNKAQAGATVSDRVRGLVDQINWDYAVIERLNKAELRTELIPFNLGKAVVQKDPQHNLQLQPGDVVTIMGSNDVQLPAERKTRLVRVEGEVAAPGVYQALPGETLPQLLKRVGGVTPQAYLYGTEFTRESVRKQQQQNLDQVIRRLESQLQSAGATLAANLTGERAAQAQTLQQQQQQQMQSQITRLKALKSKGRVALELEPDDSDNWKARATLSGLPNVPLEDGDAILVPALPAFVSAAGSVNNENVMLYKSGKTVGDIIKAAGLAEDAEPSEAFVLRADGSVFSRRTTGWFSGFESAKVMPGDTVIVPPKVDRETQYNFVVRALRDWTQIFSNLGIGAAAIRTLRN